MHLSGVRRRLLGIYLLVLGVVVAYLIIELWPQTGADNNWEPAASVLGQDFTLDDETRMIALVMLIGALGSYVHIATSFATFVGNRKFIDSWAWWYVLRPFIGMALALIFYFFVRGGLMSFDVGPSEVNAYGIAAISGLVGMFSARATDKARELFDVMIPIPKGQGDDRRADKLNGSPSTDAK